MKMGNLVAGLQLLQRYYDKPNGYNVGADHDVIYAYATDLPLPPPVVGQMCGLGWHQPEVNTGDEDFKPEHYQPSEGWAYYV